MAEEAILGFLQNNEQIPDSGQFSAEHNLDHDQVNNVIRSLQGFRYIDAQDITRKTWILTEEGKKYAAQGSPELQLSLAVPEEGSISVVELKEKLGESTNSCAWNYAKKKSGWRWKEGKSQGRFNM